MKSRLKDNNGMALTMVMVILVVLTFMGTAMYAYSMQSLDVVKWGTSRKKAEYISRAGIEAAAFAYQDTELATSDTSTPNYDYSVRFMNASRRKYSATEITAETGSTDKKKIAIQYTDDTGSTKIYNENEIDDRTQIVTNWIYMCSYNSNIDSEDKAKQKVVYVDGGNGEEPAPPDRDYIGCFRVTISDKPQLVHTDSTCTKGNDCDNKEHWRVENYKQFVSVGKSGGKSSIRTASVVSTNYANTWVDNTGHINLEAAMADDNSISKAGTLKLSYPAWYGILPGNTGTSELDLYAGVSVGNLSVNNPSKNDMKFRESGSNSAAFVGMNDLFVNSNIDVAPTRPGFRNPPNINMLYLSGNNIVIDGTINMYAYYFSNNWWTNIWSTLAGNIRLGTVVINVPSPVETTVDDPLAKTKGGLGQCGKIYFNGDVFVTIGTRNLGTKRYKIFSAGDVYYFDARFQSRNDTSGNVVYGIDLLKYFLDTSIERERYSASVRSQFQKIIDYYYSSTYTNRYTNKYTATTTPSMRLIDVKKGGADKTTDLIPPTKSDSSYIIWE